MRRSNIQVIKRLSTCSTNNYQNISISLLGTGNPTTVIINPALNTVSRNSFTAHEGPDYNEWEKAESEDEDIVEATNCIINDHVNAPVSSSESEQDSDDPMSDNDEGSLMKISCSMEVGQVTGIQIYTNSQLMTRQRRWKRKLRQRRNVESSIRKKNLVQYALRSAWNLQLNGTSKIQRVEKTLGNYSKIVPDNYAIPLQFSKGWARRRKNGQMYGPKYVAAYRAYITEMFNLGELDKKNKRSAAQMLEMLSKKYPDEFCLPSENDIRGEINRLQTKKKNPITSSRGEKVAESIYSVYIKELAYNSSSLKPKDVVNLIKERFPRLEHPDLPSDAQIKSKFTYQKKCVKKSQENNADVQ